MILDLSANPSELDELSRRDELAERLRWLINLRWVALASVCAVIFGARQLNLVVSVWPLVFVTATMAVLNLGFHGLHSRFGARTLRALSAEAMMQTAVDVISLGSLLFFAGGLSNPFVFFFTFHVVIAAILLEKREAYGVAMLTAGVVLLLGMADEFGFSSTWKLEDELFSTSRSSLARFGLVFALDTTLVISVYLVTSIMDRLRARSSDVRRLNKDLAERVEMLASAERKLAAEHQRARAILECMDEGVVVVDLQGKVLLANSAAQQSAMLALSDTLRQAGCHESPGHGDCHGPMTDENLLHHHHHHAGECSEGHAPKSAEEIAKDSCPLGSPAACLSEALEKGGMLCPATLALLGADAPKPDDPPALTPPKSPMLAQIELQGRRFENTVSAVRTSGNETLGLVVVSRDVTQRRSLERQVVHAEKLHALGNLAAGLAHELNTPLATILGYAQMLLEEIDSRKELHAIEDQARRCRKIVQQLLDFARKSHGGLSECAPNELAGKVRELLRHPMQMRGIEITLDLCAPPPPRILVAVDEIEQVLVNLITNAADAIEMKAPAEVLATAGAAVAGETQQNAPASRERRLNGDARITVQTRYGAPGEVLFAVEDNGPGVPAEIAEQIFEPFFTTKVAGRGTGLGLSIARRIIEDHNGTLTLTQRTDGQPGARFEVRLKRTSQRDR
jgi:signal transduction histidine kinase/PAS domain-containing protein